MLYLLFLFFIGNLQYAALLFITLIVVVPAFASRGVAFFAEPIRVVFFWGSVFYNLHLLVRYNPTWNFTPDDGVMYLLTHPYHSGVGPLFPKTYGAIVPAEQYVAIIENLIRLDINLLSIAWKIALLFLVVGCIEALLQRAIAFVLRIEPSKTALSSWLERFLPKFDKEGEAGRLSQDE